MTLTVDPFKDFTPRANPSSVNIQPTPAEGISEAELQKLLSDPSELRNLAKRRLIEIIALSKPTTVLVPAIKELLDRIDGKAPQSIAMVVENKGLDQLSTEKLIRLASMLDEPIIVAPMPKKLDVDN